MFTPYAELDALLADLVRSARRILGDTYVGAYLQGSFALGAGDLHSDCDFVIVTTTRPSGAAEAGLRALHDEIPTREGFWAGEIEGSYADTASLRTVAGLGVPWLYCDRGHRVLVNDTHCNTPHTRWILRHHGIALDGPPAASLVDEVPPAALRDEMRAALPTLLDDIATWAPLDVAWTQRYAVTACCRALYTLRTAQVASKRAALEWAVDALDPQWRPLLTQAAEDRALGWDPAQPPRPGSMAETRRFAAYAASLA
ncbi:aminoglycoside adenylyltransferase domain-containing protein [Actinosynnema sp. NPDC050436]|uniref:aminoglycoside adenylyltransferase domain-containing protein n=1 Tax=Actinosynnema sp. NPDC050436 TaxID=3155659 RepID=UPI00340FDAE2